MVHWATTVTVIIAIIVIIVGLVRGGTIEEPPLEAKGDPLPDAVIKGFRIIFGGNFPDWMAYTYTIVPFLILPALGAFILIYFLAQNILPGKFAASLAIIVVFIACYSGAFLKLVFGTLSVFGWYGYLLVWIMLIISATSWGVGRIATDIKSIEKEILEAEKEITKTRKEIEELEKKKEMATEALKVLRSSPHPNPKAEEAVIKIIIQTEKEKEKKKKEEGKKVEKVKKLEEKKAKQATKKYYIHFH